MATDTPTAPQTKSTCVTVVAWLFIVMSGCATPISLFQNIMILTMFPRFGAPPDDAFADLPVVSRFLFSHMELFFHAFLVVCIYTLVCSIGLLKRRNWARRGFIALLCAGVLYQVAGFAFQSVFMTEMAGRGAPDDEFRAALLMMRLFGAGMAIGLVILFGWMIKKLTSPPIRAEFGA